MQRSRNTPTLGNRLITIGLGLVITAGGVFFCQYLWRDYREAAGSDHWVETPCEILASTIEEAGFTQRGAVKYQLEVRYRYVWEGDSWVGNRVKPHRPIASADRGVPEKWQKRFPAGALSTCFVNPDAPDEAVLKRDSKAALYSIWFPALFVVGGMGIAISGLRRSPAALKE